MEEAYLDPARFPLTTQNGLTLRQQQLIDAFNWDELEEAIRAGKRLTPTQPQILGELYHKRLLARG
jgi:hypothetical protein